jgi:hypothetical protein
MVPTLPYLRTKIIKRLLKNYLFQSKKLLCLINGKLFSLWFVLFCSCNAYTQNIANFVSNGSFEELYNCTGSSSLSKVKKWLSTDSTSFGGVLLSKCNLSVPKIGNLYQYPRTGNTYIGSTYFANSGRGYQKNRLKTSLKAGKKYCVKFYVNICNSSPRGIDGFGAYFGDVTIDTISKCTIPLTFINPQVKNPSGNVITDTLVWVPITGTFVASGIEKYLLLGNFLGDSAVTTSPLFGPYFPAMWCDVGIDDVSCIEMDLPAYAGSDKSIIPGDSIFIGREPDFAIDPGCVWYVLPSMTPIDTISGMWVKPVVTTTYVVRQELDCSSTKWDTVVVYMNLVGNVELERFNAQTRVFPSPANNELVVECDLLRDGERLSVKLLNNLGECIKEEEVTFHNKQGSFTTKLIPDGVYSVVISGNNGVSVMKRFVVAH